MAPGRTSNGGKPGRKVGTKRRDVTKCMSGKHDWIPENIERRKNSWGYVHDSCRPCRNERGVLAERIRQQDDPIVRRIPGRAPQKKGAYVVEDYLDLRRAGVEFNDIAARLEMKREALARALQRAGVPR